VISLCRTVANITGLIVLAFFFGLCFALYPGIEEVRSEWTFFAGVYVLFGAIGWWEFWRKDPDGTSVWWVEGVLVSIGLGAAFFVCDIVLGKLTHPQMSLLNAGVHAGGIAGFPVTLMVCPGMTLVALAGWSRSRVLKSLIASAPRKS
jgi:hypothetical protein